MLKFIYSALYSYFTESVCLVPDKLTSNVSARLQFRVMLTAALCKTVKNQTVML